MCEEHDSMMRVLVGSSARLKCKNSFLKELNLEPQWLWGCTTNNLLICAKTALNTSEEDIKLDIKEYEKVCVKCKGHPYILWRLDALPFLSACGNNFWPLRASYGETLWAQGCHNIHSMFKWTGAFTGDCSLLSFWDKLPRQLTVSQQKLNCRGRKSKTSWKFFYKRSKRKYLLQNAGFF